MKRTTFGKVVKQAIREALRKPLQYHTLVRAEKEKQQYVS